MGLFGMFKRDVASPTEAVWRSEIGLQLPDNQDHVFVDADAGVFCVADGMGGGADGALASEWTCERIAGAIANAQGRTLSEICGSIESAVKAVHLKIVTYAVSHQYGFMGTTVAILVVDPNDRSRGSVGYVGDSRVYRIRGGMARSLTSDHSVGFALSTHAGKDAKSLRDRANPLAHVLTRAIGVGTDVNMEWRPVEIRSGDRYLICTDGVHDVVTDARIAIFAGGGPLSSAADRLSAEVVAKGAPDNYSFVLTRMP